MTRPKDMTPDEYDAWFDGLTKPEKLAEMREFRIKISSMEPPEGATEEELADYDISITFLEAAIAFEAATRIEDVKQLPEVDALEMMWEWIGDIAQDRGRRAREMGLDGDTIRRWSKTIGTMHHEATKRRKELRAKGVNVPQLWRVDRLSEPEPDNQPVKELSPQDLADLPSLLPNANANEQN